MVFALCFSELFESLNGAEVSEAIPKAEGVDGPVVGVAVAVVVAGTVDAGERVDDVGVPAAEIFGSTVGVGAIATCTVADVLVTGVVAGTVAIWGIGALAIGAVSA